MSILSRLVWPDEDRAELANVKRQILGLEIDPGKNLENENQDIEETLLQAAEDGHIATVFPLPSSTGSPTYEAQIGYLEHVPVCLNASPWQPLHILEEQASGKEAGLGFTSHGKPMPEFIRFSVLPNSASQVSHIGHPGPGL